MQVKRKVLFCIALLIISSVSSADTYKVMLYSPNNPPYIIFEGDKEVGIFIDIFTEIGKITGDKFEFVHLPIARALLEFDKGNVDIEPGVNPNWRQHLKVIGQYSVSYAQSDEVIVFSPGNKIEVNGPADLMNEIVGIVRGFSYPDYDAAFSTDSIIRINNVSQTHLLEQLLKKRFKQIFVGLNTILYFQKVYPEYQSIEIGNVVDSQSVMMRVHPDKAELMPRLNKALETLMLNKEIEKIYARYR